MNIANLAHIVYFPSIYLSLDQAYQTTTEVLQALKNKQVDIALLDAFAAASQVAMLKKDSLKVKEVIAADAGYGVVLSHEFVRLDKDFRSFISSNQDRITSFISNMTAKLTVSAFIFTEIKCNLITVKCLISCDGLVNCNGELAAMAW